MRRLGVDVGGTFTDAVLVDGDRLVTAKAPSTPDDQSRGVLAAVRAALEMRDAHDEINAYLENLTDTRFATGVGIHFGTAVVGEIGHAAKKQFTAIGDTINLASRVESATKTYETDLLVTECVLRHVADRVRLGRSFVAELKGKSGRYSLHEVLGLAGDGAK